MVGLQSPAQATYWLIQGRILFLIIHLLGVACFAYIVAKRLTPLLRGERDLRFDQPLARLGRVAKFWFGQWKHPRYKLPAIHRGQAGLISDFDYIADVLYGRAKRTVQAA